LVKKIKSITNFKQTLYEKIVFAEKENLEEVNGC